MGYEIALNKAWDAFLALKPAGNTAVKFLASEYLIDFKEKQVISVSCNTPAKSFSAILILHYLAAQLKGLPALTGEWLNFKELSAVEGYGAAFKERVIKPLLRKYGSNPVGVLAAVEKFSAKKAGQGDVGIILEVFPMVPALVIFWRGDDEFGPEANVLFDRSIRQIFCTEDIIVLAGMVASAL